MGLSWCSLTQILEYDKSQPETRYLLQFMYPVASNSSGHLMGKKSIESPPEVQDSNQDSDYLTSSETVKFTQLNQFQRLMEALLQLKNQKHTMPQTADRLLWLHWREEDKDKYLREVMISLILTH